MGLLQQARWPGQAICADPASPGEGKGWERRQAGRPPTTVTSVTYYLVAQPGLSHALVTSAGRPGGGNEGTVCGEAGTSLMPVPAAHPALQLPAAHGHPTAGLRVELRDPSLAPGEPSC